MSQDKYIGMDVHQASVSVAVLDGGGEAHHGVRAGDESQYDRRVYPGSTWQSGGDL